MAREEHRRASLEKSARAEQAAARALDLVRAFRAGLISEAFEPARPTKRVVEAIAEAGRAFADLESAVNDLYLESE